MPDLSVLGEEREKDVKEEKGMLLEREGCKVTGNNV